jgi:hypothetical protein
MTRNAQIDFDDVDHYAVKYSRMFFRQYCDETAQGSSVVPASQPRDRRREYESPSARPGLLSEMLRSSDIPHGRLSRQLVGILDDHF